MAALLACAGGRATAAAAQGLTADEVRGIVARTASEAQRRGLAATVAVVDAEGALLALYRMAGATAESVVEGQPSRDAASGCGRDGLEGLALPSTLVALAKATTGTVLSSGGHAFSSRTAGFLVQQHFPPTVERTPGGPLLGVQLSNLACSDVSRPGSPLGLALEPGGLPLYRDGRVVGGVGVEGDGRYTVASTSALVMEAVAEELSAAAGAVGFEAPSTIRAELIVVEGIRLPYLNAREAPAEVAPVAGVDLLAPRPAAPSRLVPAQAGGLPGFTLPTLGLRGGSLLDAGEVSHILGQAARQAARSRSALRRPLNSAARVTIAVVDVDGAVLGLFRAEDAPFFGIDDAVQKARTAAFFSASGSGEELRRAGMAAFAQEVPLDGSIAYTTRAIGFLAQPFLPPGITGTDPGPFSTAAPPAWSPFNTGLQLDLVCDALEAAVSGFDVPRCTPARGLDNGVALSPGGVPLYKGGRLAGAIGVSGDGPDQNDLVAAGGAMGFEVPGERRCDRLLVRGVRLPYLKFPRHPEL